MDILYQIGDDGPVAVLHEEGRGIPHHQAQGHCVLVAPANQCRGLQTLQSGFATAAVDTKKKCLKMKGLISIKYHSSIKCLQKSSLLNAATTNGQVEVIIDEIIK